MSLNILNKITWQKKGGGEQMLKKWGGGVGEMLTMDDKGGRDDIICEQPLIDCVFKSPMHSPNTWSHIKSVTETVVLLLRLFLMLNMMPLETENDFIALLRNED